jgi:Rhomboid family
VVSVLVAINVAIHAAEFFFPNLGLLKWGMKENTLIRAGQWWRLLSCMYLHGGWLHLGVRCCKHNQKGTLAEGRTGTYHSALEPLEVCQHRHFAPAQSAQLQQTSLPPGCLRISCSCVSAPFPHR